MLTHSPSAYGQHTCTLTSCGALVLGPKLGRAPPWAFHSLRPSKQTLTGHAQRTHSAAMPREQHAAHPTFSSALGNFRKARQVLDESLTQRFQRGKGPILELSWWRKARFTHRTLAPQLSCTGPTAPKTLPEAHTPSWDPTHPGTPWTLRTPLDSGWRVHTHDLENGAHLATISGRGRAGVLGGADPDHRDSRQGQEPWVGAGRARWGTAFWVWGWPGYGTSVDWGVL